MSPCVALPEWPRNWPGQLQEDVLLNPNSYVQKHIAAVVIATMFLAEHEYWI